MAITYNKRQEELNNQQGKIGSANPYTGMKGVSQNTANNLGNYQSGYTQSKQVQKAQTSLDQIQAQKPQGYNSKWAPEMEKILQQIQNPEKFKYDFNGDELFKHYKDLFTQQAKQTGLDTMGNAVALSGGYGNSWAQSAGAQAEQQALLPLNDKALELQQIAYQRYRDALGDKQTAYNYLKDAETTDYSRYQDDMNQWLAEREYLTGRLDTERNLDLTQWQNDRDYWTGLAQVENAAYNTEQERQEAIRQYEKNFAESQRQYNETMAENQRQYNNTLAENQRQYNETMAENKRQFDANFGEGQRQFDANFGEGQRQYDASLAENQRQYDTTFAEEQRQYNQQLAKGYVEMFIQQGKIPSMEMMLAAGLSEADAQTLISMMRGQIPDTINVNVTTGGKTSGKKVGDTIGAAASQAASQSAANNRNATATQLGGAISQAVNTNAIMEELRRRMAQ